MEKGHVGYLVARMICMEAEFGCSLQCIFENGVIGGRDGATLEQNTSLHCHVKQLNHHNTCEERSGKHSSNKIEVEDKWTKQCEIIIPTSIFHSLVDYSLHVSIVFMSPTMQ